MVGSKSPKTPASGLQVLEEEVNVKSASDEGAELMQFVLAKPSNAGRSAPTTEGRINGVVIGTLYGQDEHGHTMIHYPGMPDDAPLAALSTEDLNDQIPGSEVALGFVNGNPLKPIILGLIQKVTDTTVSNAPIDQESASELNVRMDGERLILSADREITLKCGKSSITLTRAGKVIVKGAYISNHSTGVNRIKGGSVQIN